MKTYNSAANTHIAQESTRITVCGWVQKQNGQIVRCTMFDDDVEITTGDLAGVYMSSASVNASDIKNSSDLSADNLEVSGPTASADFGITGITDDDIIAGQFRNAPFEVFICQWDNPDAWQDVKHRGYLGQITRVAEGSFTAEWRGLIQLLSQNIGRVYGDTCDVVEFCDSRCKLNAADFTFDATVTAVIDRKTFNLSITDLPDDFPSGRFDAGEVTFLTGDNTGYTKQIKVGASGGVVGHLQLWERLPADVQIGDTCTIFAGCLRRFEDCQAYGNYKNFRGHGHWMPGIAKIIRAPS